MKKYFYFIRRENGTERSGKVIRWEGERLSEKVVLFHLEGKRNGAEESSGDKEGGRDSNLNA